MTSHLPSTIDPKLAIKCFKRHRGEMGCIEFSLPTLANKLYSKGIITLDASKDARNENRGMSNRVADLLDCVEAKIGTEFANFVDILGSDSYYDNIVVMLVCSYNGNLLASCNNIA